MYSFEQEFLYSVWITEADISKSFATVLTDFSKSWIFLELNSYGFLIDQESGEIYSEIGNQIHSSLKFGGYTPHIPIKRCFFEV